MKRTIAVVLALALCLTVFCAFAETSADDLTQARTITIWGPKDDYKVITNYEEAPVVQYLDRMFNCTLKFQQPAMGSEMDQFSLMLGTGSYTDVMEISYCQEGIATMYEDGVIQDLAPYLEKYAPNFYAFLNAPENEDVKRALYVDGHLFTLPMDVPVEENVQWGGMVYRRDILETMTGGNIAFPSGKDYPSTVDDYEYALNLMTQYFQAAGMTDYAGIILPYQGYFDTGELMRGFGANGTFFVDEDGTVKFGLTEEGFRNYVAKMHEWYEKGYVYKDFASRTNDVFYLPNTALTYGGAAGIWWGMDNQLGGSMSMPEYGLIMDVEAAGDPVDTAHGIEKALPVSGTYADRALSNRNGYVVSTSCSEENLIRFLTVADYFFTDEGSILRSCGLDAEQSKGDKLYAEAGMENGSYTLDGTKFHWADPMNPDSGEIATNNYAVTYLGTRLPGIKRNDFTNQYVSELKKGASDIWLECGTEGNYPGAIVLSGDDNTTFSLNYTSYTDYINTMVPKFILGTVELNDDTWAEYVQRVNSLGAEENCRMQQKYYDKYIGK